MTRWSRAWSRVKTRRLPAPEDFPLAVRARHSAGSRGRSVGRRTSDRVEREVVAGRQRFAEDGNLLSPLDVSVATARKQRGGPSSSTDLEASEVKLLPSRTATNQCPQELSPEVADCASKGSEGSTPACRSASRGLVVGPIYQTPPNQGGAPLHRARRRLQALCRRLANSARGPVASREVLCGVGADNKSTRLAGTFLPSTPSLPFSGLRNTRNLCALLPPRFPRPFHQRLRCKYDSPLIATREGTALTGYDQAQLCGLVCGVRRYVSVDNGSDA